MIFQKRQNCGDYNVIIDCQGLGQQRDVDFARHGTEDIGGSKNTLYDTVMMDICQYVY